MSALLSIITSLAWVFMLVAFIGSAYQLLAATAIWRLAAQKRPVPPSRPPVTMLKPLYGNEPGLYENLRSFCDQDYPRIQLVFGVHRADDPAASVVRRLQKDLPEVDIALVVSQARYGTNHKISNLINMMSAAKHDILVLSDSDMRVDAAYLDAVVGTLERPGVGLATCLYTGMPSPGPWSALGAAGINLWFLPSAAVSKLLGGKIGCYGATIAIRRETLESVGGFAAVKDQLADDYALGALVRASGSCVSVVPYFPATLVDEPTFDALYRHELRWGRTVRNTAPIGYAGSAITHPLAGALFGVTLGSVAGLPWQMLLVAPVSAAICRLFLVARVVRTFGIARPGWWLLLPRDVLSLVILVVAYLGRSVSWRDSVFHVDRVGELFPDSDGL